ncbi:putative GTP-binding protein EngB [Candidatus Ecksteinia adelgidicola]|nr:putative GTP-binding protein EngB [Candidatus Ecksteinia adelgidicola]
MINKNYNYFLTYFITSAYNINNFPEDNGIEIAFTGYSNTGKSSALNVLTNQKRLSYVSKKPGRTQLINFFEVEKGHRLVDLPGYGYANAPKKIKQKWCNHLNKYLQTRNCLKGLVMLIDIRYPIKTLDNKMITWIIKNKIPLLILLSKADKLSFNQRKLQLNIIQKKMLLLMSDIQVECFSSLKKIGVLKLSQKLNIWFNSIYKT